MSPTLETKEAAFVYALGTAIIIHTVAKECASNNLDYCGCDGILKNTPDLDFSINFAKQLLDGKISDNATSEQHKIFISHNSKIGQSVSSIASYKDSYR